MATSFESGTSLAHYQLIAPLGAGGMGEVYKAHDLQLERTVALKILPPDLVKNDERVRRFVQEAKSASSLNHPNIVTIHEIGQAQVDSNERPVHYIAMELIDGSTLRRKILDDTDLRTLLGYLAQAAEGLAKAHAAGIVHRDLKPENIMVTRDGYAKVLDFGLAKLNVKKSSDLASETTAVRQDTREGALLGTVGYMAPEQVQGKPVDHRADIFSFGCILYEAATKQRPFTADSDIDVMHKIVHDKPAPIDELNPQAPAELRRLIRRCMAKDPDKRYQSMKDLALELGEIVDEFEDLSASATSASRSFSGELARPAAPKWRALLAAIGVLAIAAVVFSVYQWRKSKARDTHATAFTAMRVTRATSSGNVFDATISPDGKYIAQSLVNPDGTFTVSVRQVATGSDVQVVPESKTPVRFLSFSRDGNYLYYTRAELESGSGYAALFQVPTLGGAPRKVLFDVDSTISFSPDGKQFAFARGFPPLSKNAVVIANADGTGERELLRTERLGVSPAAPQWSPDGTKIISMVRTLQGGVHTDLVEIDVATKKVRVIGPSHWRAITSTAMPADGSGILFVGISLNGSRQQIWFQPYPDGEPVRVTNDVNDYQSVSVTSDGATLAARVATINADATICDINDTTGGKSLGSAVADQSPFEMDASMSGAIVYDFDRGDGPDIAIVDAPGAAPRPLTNDHMSSRPTISADGKTIAFQSRREGGIPSVFLMDADGSNVRKLAGGARPAISPDGRTLFYLNDQSELFRISTSGGAPQKVAESCNGGCTIDRESKLFAYNYWKPEKGRYTQYLAVVPISGGPPVADIPYPRNVRVRFAPDGKGIVFMRFATAGVANLFVQPLTGGEPQQLTHFRKGEIAGFAFTADGKLVMARADVRNDVVLMSNFR